MGGSWFGKKVIGMKLVGEGACDRGFVGKRRMLGKGDGVQSSGSSDDEESDKYIMAYKGI